MEIVVLFGIVQCVYVLFYLIMRNINGSYNFVIALYAVLLALQIEMYLIRSGYILYILHLLNITAPMIFLLGPLLLIAITKEINGQINIMKASLHFIPYLIYFLYSFNFYLQPANYKFNQIAYNFHPEWTLREIEEYIVVDPWDIQGIVVVELFTVHILLYALLSWIKILKHKQHISLPKFNWLLFLTGIITCGGVILFFSQGGIIVNTVYFNSPFPEYSPDLFSTIAIYATMAYLLINPTLLKVKSAKYLKNGKGV